MDCVVSGEDVFLDRSLSVGLHISYHCSNWVPWKPWLWLRWMDMANVAMIVALWA